MTQADLEAQMAKLEADTKEANRVFVHLRNDSDKYRRQLRRAEMKRKLRLCRQEVVWIGDVATIRSREIQALKVRIKTLEDEARVSQVVEIVNHPPVIICDD